MEPIELRLLDTEKNYDPSLVKELVCHYNHNQSTSISLEDFKHILDTIDYILEHGETFDEGIQSIQSEYQRNTKKFIRVFNYFPSIMKSI